MENNNRLELEELKKFSSIGIGNISAIESELVSGFTESDEFNDHKKLLKYAEALSNAVDNVSKNKDIVDIAYLEGLKEQLHSEEISSELGENIMLELDKYYSMLIESVRN